VPLNLALEDTVDRSLVLVLRKFLGKAYWAFCEVVIQCLLILSAVPASIKIYMMKVTSQHVSSQLSLMSWDLHCSSLDSAAVESFFLQQFLE
jgi:hypothetical protein